jgi:hypothetical protein
MHHWDTIPRWKLALQTYLLDARIAELAENRNCREFEEALRGREREEEFFLLGIRPQGGKATIPP